jgi:hypothetical protein
MRHLASIVVRAVVPLACCCLVISARGAQVPGFAEITQPAVGDQLAGVVTITGTAFHPEFQAYAVSFAYDPNPTETWFPVGDRSTTAVSDGRLAVWDTTGITPGTYQLRLTVTLKQGTPLEAYVRGLVIGEAPSPAVTPEVTLTTPTAITTPLAEGAAAAGAPTQPSPPSPGATVLEVLKVGALSALAILALIGGYAFLRPRLRVYLASMQTRRLYPRRRRGQREDRR